MNSPLHFLRKVIRIRKALIRAGRSHRPAQEMEVLMQPIDQWLSHWGNQAKDDGALTIMRIHADKLSEIIPGGEKGCGPALRQQLNEFLTNTYYHERSEKL